MGEVYRAKDTRLGREVAIKVLPAGVAADAERLRRFEQEARAASALNHANILTLHDLGFEEGAPYLVMELLDGRSLREVLASGETIPLRKTLDWGVQVARGLAAAHAKGIIHRDLKPENLFACTDGRIKILDFGLAKLAVPEEGGSLIAHATTMADPTHSGVVMGTAGYMAPEQVRGERVDARADLFALGCVLYELLTGTRVFRRQTSADSLSAILRDEPPSFASVAPGRQVPPALEAVVRRCLEKDPAERFGSARDLAFALEAQTAEGGSSTVRSSVDEPRAVEARLRVAPSRWLRATLWTLGAICCVALGAIGFAVLRPGAGTAGAQEIRFALRLPADQIFLPQSTFSPDGRMLALVVASGLEPGRSSPSETQIVLRPLDQEEMRPLTGTRWAFGPFFSPAGDWLGINVPGRERLEKVALGSNSPQPLCEVPGDFWNAEWTADSSLYVALLTSGLFRCHGMGVPLEPILTQRDFPAGDVYLELTQVLPGANAILYATGARLLAAARWRVSAVTLADGKSHEIVRDAAWARYADGLLIFARSGGDLFAAPFDPRRLELTGPARPAGVTVDPTYGLWFSLSDNGSLAYLPPGEEAPGHLVLVDANGRETAPLAPVAGGRSAARVSPDGRQIVFDEGSENRIVVSDLTGQRRRIIAARDAWWPIWTPDGKAIIYNQLTSEHNVVNLFRRSADGIGAPERLATSALHQQALDVTPDGRFLLYQERSEKSGFDLWLLPLDRASTPRPLVRTASDEIQGTLSPDGRWLAYSSNESGRREIYLRTFPAAEQPLRVTENGGSDPVWSRDGSALIYRDLLGRTIWSAAFSPAPVPSFATPRQIAEGWYSDVVPFGRQIDTTPDGRILASVPPFLLAHEQRVIVNWTAGLKQRLGRGS